MSYFEDLGTSKTKYTRAIYVKRELFVEIIKDFVILVAKKNVLFFRKRNELKKLIAKFYILNG